MRDRRFDLERRRAGNHAVRRRDPMIYQGPAAEEKLLEYLHGLQSRKTPDARSGIHLHLSRLQAKHRQPYHIRIAINILKDNLQPFDSSIFLCHNSDLIVTCRGARTPQLEEIAGKVQYFFSGDTPSSEEDEQAADEPEAIPHLSTIHDLSVDCRGLLTICEQMLGEKVRQATEEIEGDPESWSSLSSLDPGRLARLAASLASTDVSNFLRRQPICKFPRDAIPESIAYELYVHIADLQRVTLPDIDIRGNQWLFNYFTRILDDRVLSLLTKHKDEYLTEPISVNLNLETLLSQKFLNFSNGIDGSIRRRFALELQLVDVVADLQSFVFARSFLKEYSYMLMADGITQHTLPDLAAANLQFDRVKVIWDPKTYAETESSEKDRIVGAIERLGPENIIFCRCGNREVIEAGHNLGITLFQGRFVDRIVNPNSRRIN